MAATFYQNQNSYTVAVPTAGGISVNVEPSKFVKDNTGISYQRVRGLTSVLENAVVASDLVYTYDPVQYAQLDSETGKLETSQDPTGVSGYSGFSGATGASGFSGISGFSGYSGTVGVASLAADSATLTGAVTLIAGTGITITVDGQNVTISAA